MAVIQSAEEDFAEYVDENIKLTNQIASVLKMLCSNLNSLSVKTSNEHLSEVMTNISSLESDLKRKVEHDRILLSTLRFPIPKRD